MTETTHISHGQRVAHHVDTRAAELQNRYLRNESGAVADLARLRSGIGAAPGADLELLDVVFAETDVPLHDRPPTADAPTGGEEQAVYAALTLFALHQQSRRDARMHRDGYSFGRSARLLGRKDGVSREAVRARFAALATATTWDETLHHARGLIQQFRQHAVPLDYGRFARDLYDLHDSRSADRVRLAWGGRDFYRAKHPQDDDAEPNRVARDAAPDTDS